MRVTQGLWIVEWPKPGDDVALIHFASSIESFAMKFQGDLKPDNIAGLFTTSEEANQYSIDLMAAFNKGREATK